MVEGKETPAVPREQLTGIYDNECIKDTHNQPDKQTIWDKHPGMTFVDMVRAGVGVVDFSKKKEPSSGMFRVRTANECLLEAMKQPIPRQLFDTLIFEGEITLIYADTNVGKTIFAVQIGNEIAQTFGEKVLYIDLELSDKQFEARYSENYINHFKFADTFYRIDFQRRFSIPDGMRYEDFFLNSIRELIQETGAKIIFIDNMTKLVSGDTDQAKTAKPLMDRLTDLKFDLNLTLILLEHTRKTDDGRPISLNDLQGSKMKVNFADAAFTIGRSSKDKNLRYVKQMKCRSAEILYDSENVAVYEIIKENSFVHFRFAQFDTEFTHLKRLDDSERDNRKEKAIELRAAGVSNRNIAKELGVSEGTIRYWQK